MYCEICELQREQRQATATEFMRFCFGEIISMFSSTVLFDFSCHVLTNMVGVIEGETIEKITRRETKITSSERDVRIMEGSSYRE